MEKRKSLEELVNFCMKVDEMKVELSDAIENFDKEFRKHCNNLDCSLAQCLDDARGTNLEREMYHIEAFYQHWSILRNYLESTL